MRYLFTTQPGTGHLHPLLPVAAGLRDAGHDVTFAASGGLATELDATGFSHHPVGRPWHTAQITETFPAITAIPPGPDRYAWARRRIFAHDTTLDVVPDMVRLAAEWRPDVIVRDAAEYGGYITAELLGLPHAVVRTDSGSSSYADRHHVAPELDAVRARHGLAPDPDGVEPFRHLLLSFAPPGLDEEPFTPTGVRLRPQPPLGGSSPAWLDPIARRGPVVYATLGTVYNSPELLADIIDALADEPLGLVVTTGGRPYERRLPPNAHVAPWLPQETVLPHCAGVITHGGFGTASAALGHGLPMVLLPISADQPLNAARLTAAGVGITLAPAGRSPAAIRAATRRLLDDPSLGATARRLAEQATRRPALDHGVELLEQLAVGSSDAAASASLTA